MSSQQGKLVGSATDPSAANISRVKEILKQPESAPAAKTVTQATGQIVYHAEVVQGSDEWLALRRGILTASEMHLIITPTLKVADNDKVRAHVWEIAAQRITGYVEPQYVSDSMMRGNADEIEARLQYILNYGPVEEMGFITNSSLGFKIGYSPDGLVGMDGSIECKSRCQKLQLQTIVDGLASVPAQGAMIQMQTGMWAANLKWCDYVSYCGGMPMATFRVFPDAKIQTAIIEAATAFELKVQSMVDKYHETCAGPARLIPTERRVEEEMI